jgi:LysM repeat protein
MRTLILDKASDVKQFLADRSRNGLSIETLQRLNPHVDLKKIAAGTVLFVPDAPDGAADGSQPVGGTAFSAFQSLVSTSLDTAGAGVRSGFAARAQERQDVVSAIKTAAAKRVIESNPEIKTALEAAVKQDKLDQQQAKTADSMLAAVKQQITADLGALGKRLG